MHKHKHLIKGKKQTCSQKNSSVQNKILKLVPVLDAVIPKHGSAFQEQYNNEQDLFLNLLFSYFK